MSGNAAYDQQDGGLFILGRAGGGTLNMSGSASMSNTGEIWFGMDSTFTGTVSGNSSISASNIHMARFASPSSELTLQDNASVTTGFFIMSDAADLSGSSTLNLEGSGLSLNFDGLFAREGATLNFVADAGGISTINLNNAAIADLFDNADPQGLNPQLVVDLTAFAGLGEVTLVNKDGAAAVNGQFRDLAEGALVAGTNGRTISYVGGDGNDIVLSAVPEPSSLALLALGGLALARRRR